jgi:RNA polymerase sigma-70 factor (ECF subfamily)
MKTNSYADIDPHIVAVIKREASKLIGRYGYTNSDVDDIEQDLHLKVWSSLKEVDNAIFEAAVHRVVNHEIIDMIRQRQRQCRDWRRIAFSVNATRSGEAFDNLGTERSSILDEGLLVALGYSPSWQSRRWEQADVEEGMGRLPGDLRAMAENLEACDGNLSAAARMLGVSRKKARILFARLQKEVAWLRDE